MTAPVIAQSFSNEGVNPPDTQLHGISQPFAANTGAGNTIIVFGTVSDYSGVHNDSKMTDTANNSYVFKNQQNTSQTGGSATIWCYIAQNIAGDNVSPANVSQGFTIGGDVEDYQSFYALEIGYANTTSYVGVSGNTQNALLPGANAIQSGTITVSADQVPCMMIALAINSSGSGGSQSPAVGNGGMTLVANCWGFFSGQTCAAVAYQNITVAGTYQALFDQNSSVAEDIGVIAIIVKGNSSVVLPTRFKIYANGAIQANAFIQAPLPSGIAMRFYSNNALHVANLVSTGTGKIKLFANGQLSVNSTIIV